jgi:hypothetical protein
VLVSFLTVDGNAAAAAAKKINKRERRRRKAQHVSRESREMEIGSDRYCKFQQNLIASSLLQFTVLPAVFHPERHKNVITSEREPFMGDVLL